MSNLALRILAATIGIPLLLWGAIFGGIVLAAVVVAIQLLILREWYDLAKAAGVGIWPGSLIIAGAGLDGLVFFPGNSNVLIVAVAAVYLWILISVFDVSRIPLKQLGLGALFLVYAVIPTAMWTLIARNSDELRHGALGALGVLFAATWLCDSAAYFVGRAIGRHKLYPQASPNKTVEGALGGAIGAASLLPMMAIMGIARPTIADYFVLPGIVGIAGQIGDLIESLMKRESGLKDSSHIIPGHGGILDRFDSLLLSAPFYFAYLNLTAK